eukprot:TRINITY_DN34877_c0_g1_i1.p1 TRINITY_DN34877_c0_g1~~TRINITY_DN34877_c0_g1_i1.p1  ORF type:complete len:572 (+),score=69.05 TRINITY_DN34877_c0_g1_i1:65-1780(+)
MAFNSQRASEAQPFGIPSVRPSETSSAPQLSAQRAMAQRRAASDESLVSARPTEHDPNARLQRGSGSQESLVAARPTAHDPRARLQRRAASQESLVEARPTGHNPRSEPRRPASAESSMDLAHTARPLTGQRPQPPAEALSHSDIMFIEPAAPNTAAQRALDRIELKDYEEGEDATVVAKGCWQKLIAAAILTEQHLDNAPFPQIRPLRLLRRPGCVHRSCESNQFCFFFAKRGCMICGILRKLLLVCCFGFTFTSFLLRIFPPLALNNTLDRSALYEYPWAVGIYDCIAPETCLGVQSKVYIGLASVFVETTSDEVRLRKIIPFDSPECPEKLALLGPDPYCENCQSAAYLAAIVCILSIPTVLVSFWMDIQRMSVKNDHNCIKCWGLILHTLSLLFLLLTVTIFFGLCIHKFPKIDASDIFRMELEIAKGGLLVVFALVTNVFAIFLHFFIPVPEARWRYVHRDEDPAFGLWPRTASRRSDVVSIRASSGSGGGLSKGFSTYSMESVEERHAARSNFLRVFTKRLASFGGGKADDLNVDDFDGVSMAPERPQAQAIGSPQKPPPVIAPE